METIGFYALCCDKKLYARTILLKNSDFINKILLIFKKKSNFAATSCFFVKSKS